MLVVNPWFTKLNQSLQLDDFNSYITVQIQNFLCNRECWQHRSPVITEWNTDLVLKCRDTIWRSLNVLMMASQQWPQDSLNESETKKDDWLVNKFWVKILNLKREMIKTKNQRCSPYYDHMQECQALCQRFGPAAAPSMEKAKLRCDYPSLFKASSLWRSAFPKASR